MYSWENYHAIKDFMTEELWRLSNLSPQKLGEFNQNVAPEKHRFATNK